MLGHEGAMIPVLGHLVVLDAPLGALLAVEGDERAENVVGHVRGLRLGEPVLGLW
jgi:hypothetical protein